MNVALIAVYGSLKKGFGNHSLISSSEFIGEGITNRNFTMVSFVAFPGIFNNEDTDLPVKVEVYGVTSETLDRLDRLEGSPSFYHREPTEVTLSDGTVVATEIYVLTDARGDKNLVPADGIYNWSRS